MASYRFANRNQPLETIGLSPQAFPPPPIGTKERSTRNRPLLVDAEQRLLLGSTQLAKHLSVRPRDLIQAIVLEVVSTIERKYFQELDEGVPSPSGLISVVACLRRNRMPLAQIAKLIPQIPNVTRASTLAGLASASPYVLNSLDRGAVSLSHAALLLPFSRGDQEHWVGEIIAHRLSVTRLRKRLHGKASSAGQDANVAWAKRCLSERLGAEIEIRPNNTGAGVMISIAWTTIEELQGVIEAINRAPPAGTPLTNLRIRRDLEFSLQGPDEFEQLLGHLMGE